MYPEPKEYDSWLELTQCKSVLSSNHQHMKDFTDRDFLLFGFSFLQKISDILRKQYPDKTFYGTVSTDLNMRDCVVRFHCLHEGEEHLVIDNLERFKIDAVCLIEL